MGNGSTKQIRVDWHPDGNPCGTEATVCGVLDLEGSLPLAEVRIKCLAMPGAPSADFLFVQSNASIIRQVSPCSPLSNGRSGRRPRCTYLTLSGGTRCVLTPFGEPYLELSPDHRYARRASSLDRGRTRLGRE
eukprot:TRINITY_DN10348_c0_g1_i5.p1 TRINITY_DN10348_c0_g1~~TRINITY_DN10348_c0_g1_i5.p1  ORF type:complete len:133 (+),score=6.69 TRINITY_DN10348_c0_g1_i5:74-472(+)